MTVRLDYKRRMGLPELEILWIHDIRPPADTHLGKAA